MLITLLVLNCLHHYVASTKLGGVSALADNEYEIMLKKVTGQLDSRSDERSVIEKSTIRKFYRWIKGGKTITIGASGKTLYIDGKQLFRKSELTTAIKRVIKDTKDSGSRKLRDRLLSALTQNVTNFYHNFYLLRL